MTDIPVISRAIFWSALEILSVKGFGFLVSVVLARLIAPEEFGLIAMLMFFSAVAGLFMESGFASALIQRQDHTYIDECTVFWFNLVAGGIATTTLILIAPWIASFYEEPILVPLTKLMALNLWMSAFLTVPTALLTKKLDFKTQMKAGICGLVASGGIAIYLAIEGWGVWALAVQSLSATLVTGSVLWKLNSWRPSWIFSWDSFRRLFSFGGFMMLSGLLESISTKLYSLVIGKSYGAMDLGFFFRASTAKDLPQNILAGIFSRVTFPMFSARAGNPLELKKDLQIALITTMAINLPLMAGLLMTADELVPILFGSQWAPSIPILKVLCGLGAFWPLHVANLNALMAMGHSRLVLKLQVIKKTLFIITLIITSYISLVAIAWGMFALGLISIFVNTWYTKIFLDYGVLEQFKDILPYIAVTFAMMIAISVSHFIFIFKIDFMISLFVAKFIIGILSYGFLSYVFSLRALEYGHQFLGRLIAQEPIN